MAENVKRTKYVIALTDRYTEIELEKSRLISLVKKIKYHSLHSTFGVLTDLSFYFFSLETKLLKIFLQSQLTRQSADKKNENLNFHLC